MQIEMASYGEYNDTLAMMNDHLGEIYGYSNLKDVEEAQLHYEKELAYKAIKELQQENERLKKKQRLSPEERQHFHLDIDEIYEILIDYKSRCEKASEKINYYKYFISLTKSEEHMLNTLDKILQNGDDSQ